MEDHRGGMRVSTVLDHSAKFAQILGHLFENLGSYPAHHLGVNRLIRWKTFR
jgi:hypothetical protein